MSTCSSAMANRISFVVGRSCYACDGTADKNRPCRNWSELQGAQTWSMFCAEASLTMISSFSSFTYEGSLYRQNSTCDAGGEQAGGGSQQGAQSPLQFCRCQTHAGRT